MIERFKKVTRKKTKSINSIRSSGFKKKITKLGKNEKLFEIKKGK